MAGGQAAQAKDASQPDRSREAPTLPFGALLGQVPEDIRDVSFGTAVRGYDRHAVDAYVERVNRIIAELEVSRSPQSAVKHALDRVGEQTSGVLQRAREVAEELTATAMAEADHLTRRAKVEAEEAVETAQTQVNQLRAQSKEQADEVVARASAESAERLQRGEEALRRVQDEAETRLRALRADIDAAAAARSELLVELRRMAAKLDEFAIGMAGTEDAPGGGEGQPDRPTARLPRSSPRGRERGSRQPERDVTAAREKEPVASRESKQTDQRGQAIAQHERDTQHDRDR